MNDELRTARLLLRRFVESDAKQVQDLAGDIEVARTALNIPHPYEDGMAEAWIGHLHKEWQSRSRFAYAVTEAETGLLVGTCVLVMESRHRRAELGYWIGRRFWNRGYATEAAGALLSEGFGTLGLERVHAARFAANPASGRVMEKLGMRREGVLRRHVLRFGMHHDLVLYGILREEHPTREPTASAP